MSEMKKGKQMQKINLLSIEDVEKISEGIQEIKQKLEMLYGNQKWLGTSNIAKHTDLSIHTIKSKVKNNDLLEGIHYHKKGGKLLFNVHEIDKWLMGVNLKNHNYLGVQLNNEEFGREYDKYLDELL
jgi:hypothetical protein